MPGADRGAAFRGLHVLADDDPRWAIGAVEQAAAACRGGADVVQLRCKHATDRQQLEWARAIRGLTREAGVRFVLNDRFDLALAAEADGVHLGQTDMPPNRIPEHARAQLAIGFSTHDPDQARAALGEPIDYLAFGPVFGTTSKESEYSRRGIEQLREVSDIVKPVVLVAIGGIAIHNLQDVVHAGAEGFAVISAVAANDDPEAATRALAQEFAACVVRDANG